jgi:DNA-binding response OmpR family regulator
LKRILIIEDDEDILESLTLMLENAGYLISSFSNGHPILANDYILPDMFIMDKQLPGVDGLDLCRHLKSQDQTKNIPVIMLSASSSITTSAKAAMANDALEKPFKMKEFLDIVAKYI